MDQPGGRQLRRRVVGPGWQDVDDLLHTVGRELHIGAGADPTTGGRIGLGNLHAPLEFAEQFHIHDGAAVVLLVQPIQQPQQSLLQAREDVHLPLLHAPGVGGVPAGGVETVRCQPECEAPVDVDEVVGGREVQCPFAGHPRLDRRQAVGVLVEGQVAKVRPGLGDRHALATRRVPINRRLIPQGTVGRVPVSHRVSLLNNSTRQRLSVYCVTSAMTLADSGQG